MKRVLFPGAFPLIVIGWGASFVFGLITNEQGWLGESGRHQPLPGPRTVASSCVPPDKLVRIRVDGPWSAELEIADAKGLIWTPGPMAHTEAERTSCDNCPKYLCEVTRGASQAECTLAQEAKP